MQSRCNSDVIRCIIYANLDANLDAMITESEMHLITSKMGQNMNQKLDQLIKKWNKT